MNFEKLEALYYLSENEEYLNRYRYLELKYKNNPSSLYYAKRMFRFIRIKEYLRNKLIQKHNGK